MKQSTFENIAIATPFVLLSVACLIGMPWLGLGSLLCVAVILSTAVLIKLMYTAAESEQEAIESQQPLVMEMSAYKFGKSAALKSSCHQQTPVATATTAKHVTIFDNFMTGLSTSLDNFKKISFFSVASSRSSENSAEQSFRKKAAP